MVNLNIKETKKTQSGWKYQVILAENGEDLEFDVDLDEDYYKQLTNQKISPEELIRKSFRFLLSKEGKESILYSFNLRVIQKYFPEYETEIV